MVCAPITAGQVEVLKLARDNRGKADERESNTERPRR